jgi:hypothetical protein
MLTGARVTFVLAPPTAATLLLLGFVCVVAVAVVVAC